MPSALEQQRAAAALILDMISDAGSASAGSGAIREHGLSGRPTRDVDLFTNDTGSEQFAAAVGLAFATLSEHGHQVVFARRQHALLVRHVPAVPGGERARIVHHVARNRRSR